MLARGKIPVSLVSLLPWVLWLAAVAIGQEDDWTELFDGQSLDGWTQRGGQAVYSVENGQIVGTTVPNTPNSFLCTDRHFDNFVLELEFRVHPELNSGIQIRSNSLADFKNGRVHGYQVEIDPSDRAWSGGIYDEGRRGWLYDLKQRPEARNAFRQNEWNHYRVEAVGDSLRTWINGVPAADLRDDMTDSGFVALQVHGVGGRQDPIDVRWRNIRIRELPATARPQPAARPDRQVPRDKVFADDARVQLLADGFRFTEGPASGPDGRVWFSDIPNQRIHVHDPETGETSVYRENSGKANGLMWTASDALLACEGGNRKLTRQEPGREPRDLAASFGGRQLNSPNDLDLDGEGGIWFTDPRYGNRDDLEQDVEAVYYLPRNGPLRRVIDDLVRPNGIVLSPDFRTLYVADAGDGKIYRYPVTGAGKIGDGQVLIEMGSDGMTVDVDGNIYLTSGGQVHVVRPDGSLLQQLPIPESPSNVTFGGPGGGTLYITARTGFYSVPTLTRGARVPVNP